MDTIFLVGLILSQKSILLSIDKASSLIQCLSGFPVICCVMSSHLLTVLSLGHGKVWMSRLQAQKGNDRSQSLVPMLLVAQHFPPTRPQWRAYGSMLINTHVP